MACLLLFKFSQPQLIINLDLTERDGCAFDKAAHGVFIATVKQFYSILFIHI